MITVRKSDDRGHFDFDWLNTYHTFSFGPYRDAKHMHFRTLRVINEDLVAPGQAFDAHPHKDMEIITYIVSGALRHGDDIASDGSTGHSQIIRPGEVQRLSAGTGMVHSEKNDSRVEPVHLLQIWIMPDRHGHAPAYDQREFPDAERRNQLRLVASPDGAEGSIRINQDARMYVSTLDKGVSAKHAIETGRGVWVQVVTGDIAINGTPLEAGDGAAVESEAAIEIAASTTAELLVFDLA